MIMVSSSSKKTGTGYAAIALSMVVVLLVSGCASLVPQTAQVNYYKQCYEPIAKVREEHKSFTNTVVLSTAVGAVGGAAIGALIGGQRGALIGAGVGALAAGGGAYYIKKQQQIQDDNQRRASIANDIETDVSALDSITLASIQARKCYRQQFTTALADYKAGRIEKAELKARTEEIVSALNEIEKIMNTANEEGDKKYKEYQNAIAEEKAKGGPDTVSQSAAVASPKKTASASKTSRKTKGSAAPVVGKYYALDDPAQKMSKKVNLAGAEANGAASDAKEYVLSCNALGLDIAGAKKA